MPDLPPITIATVEDFARVLSQVQGPWSCAQMAAGSGHSGEAVRMHLRGEVMRPATMIDVLANCGYRMQVQLVPIESPRIATCDQPAAMAPRADDRVRSVLALTPGLDVPTLAMRARVGRAYVRQVLGRLERAGVVVMDPTPHGSRKAATWRLAFATER